MDNFLVYYSGGCFERGDSPEQAEKKAYDKVSCVARCNVATDSDPKWPLIPKQDGHLF
jgi:hypothetical protein